MCFIVSNNSKRSHKTVSPTRVMRNFTLKFPGGSGSRNWKVERKKKKNSAPKKKKKKSIKNIELKSTINIQSENFLIIWVYIFHLSLFLSICLSVCLSIYHANTHTLSQWSLSSGYLSINIFFYLSV